MENPQATEAEAKADDETEGLRASAQFETRSKLSRHQRRRRRKDGGLPLVNAYAVDCRQARPKVDRR